MSSIRSRSTIGRGEMQLLVGSLVTGFSYVGCKLAMVEMQHPWTFTTLYLICCAVLMGISRGKMKEYIISKSETDAFKDDLISRAVDRIYRNSLLSQVNRDQFELCFWGITCGVLIFFAGAFIQIAMLEISATKASFIVGLFVIIVPILEFYVLQITKKTTISPLKLWSALIISVMGLMLLSGTIMSSSGGDSAVDVSSVGYFYAFSSMMLYSLVVIANHYGTRSVDCIDFSYFETLVAAALSVVASVIIEPSQWIASPPLRELPLCWDAVLLVACMQVLAVTLQKLGQMTTAPTNAALLISLDTVFSAIIEYLFLGETMNSLEILGAALMFFSTMLCNGFFDSFCALNILNRQCFSLYLPIFSPSNGDNSSRTDDTQHADDGEIDSSSSHPMKMLLSGVTE